MTKRAKHLFQTTFDEYEVIEPVKEGGSGRVYKVRNKDSDILALKCLKPEISSSQKLKRFKNELLFCFKNEHKNVLKVLDHGIANDLPFYVMPFYSKTLRDLITEGIRTNDVLQLFAQILDGAECAHLKGISHRDLKPENVLFDVSAKTLVVADFGIAHFSEEHLSTVVLTRHDDRLGNFIYSAPEQRQKGQIVDRKADIYALGLILNEMFTKEVPQGTSFKKIGAAVPELEYLDALVESMIKQSPSDRLDSIEAIKRELIGRKNEFIVRQKLDELKNEVIPKSSSLAPTGFKEIKLLKIDYQNGRIIFFLDRVPPAEWIDGFHKVAGAQISFTSSGWKSNDFKFYQDKAEAPHFGGREQETVDRFNQYRQQTNKEHEDWLRNVAIRLEEQERGRIQNQIAEEEKRLRILKSIKI